MYFHELASELKTYMAPKSRDGEFVISLIRLSIRPMQKNISLNMLDQILEGRDKYISKARAGMICSLYDGSELAEQVDELYDGDK